MLSIERHHRRMNASSRLLTAVLGSTLLFSGLPAQAQAVTASPPVVARSLPDFADLVEQVGPSVVNIRTLERVSPNAQMGDMDEDMLEFFKRFGIPVPKAVPRPKQQPRNQPAPQPDEEQPRGVGSGFVLTPDGFVMTNAHVVDGADEVIVTLTDKREFKAKIIGADKRTDVAVVKIEATGLPAVRIAPDLAKLRVGEWVMAIGSPFGLENTVTAGIVSAKQRDTGEYLPFIQTDVAINPGNSGGPLINLRGEVVGINSQIYSRSGGFMGISFSIPIDEAIRVSDQLRQSGRVSRGRIGVEIDQVSREVAESLGLGAARGALVRGVQSGSPAEKAGVEPGDIIVRFDGKTIERPSDLPRLVGGTKPGTKSTLGVFRRGATRDIAVTIAEIEPDEVAAAPAPAKAEKAPASSAGKVLGLAVSELTAAQKKELKLKGGVRVESATDGAARAGVKEGDVILAVGNAEVSTVKEFEAALAKLDRSKVANVLVRRGEWAQYLLIRPTK
ncbi:Do family serine endopeptidase [Xylophilus sp. GOD-11R]|uniref:Do family serine endopeptidase n=1 Tax=Xylophilus sp. GOD-11R TaxID=3089814 RepID=UPI00399B3B7E